MKVTNKRVVEFVHEGGAVSLCADNRGEPFSSGVTMEFSFDDKPGEVLSAYMEESEVRRLRDILTDLLQEK